MSNHSPRHNTTFNNMKPNVYTLHGITSATRAAADVDEGKVDEDEEEEDNGEKDEGDDKEEKKEDEEDDEEEGGRRRRRKR